MVALQGACASVVSGSIRPREIVHFSPFSSCVEQYFAVILLYLLFTCDCFMVSLYFPRNVTCILRMEKGSIITFCSFFLCLQIYFLAYLLVLPAVSGSIPIYHHQGCLY